MQLIQARASSGVASASEVYEEQEEVLSILQQQATVIVNILNDVLSLSAIEDGKLRLNKRAMCFDCLLLTTLRSFHAEYLQKKISMMIHIQHTSLNTTTTLNHAQPSISINNDSTTTVNKTYVIDSLTGKLTDATSSASPLPSSSSSPPPSHEHCYMYADEYRLRQVIANFLSNTIACSAPLYHL